MWAGFLAGVTVFLIGVALLVFFAPVGAAFATMVIKGIAIGVLYLGVGVPILYPYVQGVYADMIGDTLYLPLYEVSPYEIFADKVKLFDINFFNPEDDNIRYSNKDKRSFEQGCYCARS